MNIVLLRRAEDVSEEVVRRVLLCTQAQGAETNLGAALYRGRRQIDDEMIPCASVIEGDDEIVEQKGPEVTVRQKYAIYIVGSGRINVAGMSRRNMDRLCAAIADVLG